LGSETPPRQSSFATFFNPTNTTPPFFQIFDQEFLNILGPSASIQVVAENDSFAFAHEAPVYSPATDEVFFASNAGGPLGMSDLEHNNHILKISLAEVERAVGSSGGGNVNVNVTMVRALQVLFV
jgi:gluconolactonase